MRHRLAAILIPSALALAGMVLIALWIGVGPSTPLQARVPGLDGAPRGLAAKTASRPVPGEPVRSVGRESAITAAWPCFRGPDHDAINKETVRLSRHWPSGGPKRLWAIDLGEGYAAAAIAPGGCLCWITFAT